MIPVLENLKEKNAKNTSISRKTAADVTPAFEWL
jgi:hypothetical protein